MMRSTTDATCCRWCEQRSSDATVSQGPPDMKLFFTLAMLVMTTVVAGCSTTTSPAAAPSAASQPTVSQSNVTVRIAYQKGGLALVAIQRGLVEKQLAAQGIAVSWVGPLAD